MKQRHKEEMEKNINALIDRGRFKDKAVFAFGHCNATQEMMDYLLANEINAAAILDNNESKQGFEYRGISIKMPEIMCGFSASNSIVLIAARFFAPMEAQLRRLGYDGEVIKIVDYNSFAEYSLSDHTFLRRKERVQRGIITLERIRAKYPFQYFVVCPNDALGDVYWAMSFLPAYCERHSIKNTAIIVTGNGCRQTAELFQTNVITLECMEMDELVQALLFTREKDYIIAHHDRPYTDNIIKYLDRNFLSFVDYYRYAVYGLPKDTPQVLPTYNIEYAEKERLKRGRTIIVSPFSKSIVNPPNVFWEDIVSNYLNEGFLVYTNVAGDEKPVKGTKPLSVPINQMVSAVEYAGCFIGIRSGLCDIVTTAKCKKIVVFPDCIYSKTNVKVHEFFDMPGWEKVMYCEIVT